MKREIIITEDGSHTLYVPELHEHYHSTHGAIQESRHVYIDAALKPALQLFPEIYLLEIGFGTALNALLTLLENNTGKTIYYTAIEPFPMTLPEIERINYPESLNINREIFNVIHDIPCGSNFTHVSSCFYLKMIHNTLQEVNFPEKYFNVVYFDAFAPLVQPELWEKKAFEKIYYSMASGGIMTTYSAKGSVRRLLHEIGFMVERLPAPVGKREMLRAIKQS